MAEGAAGAEASGGPAETALAEMLTAESAAGRAAIAEVMRHSSLDGAGAGYTGDVAEAIASVPPRWARARVVGGVPVSFILIEPERHLALPVGNLRYAFVAGVATRVERRRQGHFRALMQDTFASLRAAGVSLLLLHGHHQLYRRFGFDVFTHHQGVFATPDQIERSLGPGQGLGSEDVAATRLTVEASPRLHPDLLLVRAARAPTPWEARAALLEAAALARRRGKTRILFEEPLPDDGADDGAPGRYPLHATLTTPLVELARACGAEVRLQGADPAAGPVGHGDWLIVLDAAGFLAAAVAGQAAVGASIPVGACGFATEAGDVTLRGDGARVTVTPGIPPDVEQVGWPAAALAQLALGYRSAAVLAAIHRTPLSDAAAALLSALFPPGWRLSRNEDWVYPR